MCFCSVWKHLYINVYTSSLFITSDFYLEQKERRKLFVIILIFILFQVFGLLVFSSCLLKNYLSPIMH